MFLYLNNDLAIRYPVPSWLREWGRERGGFFFFFSFVALFLSLLIIRTLGPVVSWVCITNNPNERWKEWAREMDDQLIASGSASVRMVTLDLLSLFPSRFLSPPLLPDQPSRISFTLHMWFTFPTEWVKEFPFFLSFFLSLSLTSLWVAN